MNDSLSHQPKYPVLTLEKALDIIEILKNGPGDGLRITELSQRLGMGKSTIHRILDTLLAYRYIEKSENSSKYRLSWRFFEIGSMVPRQRNLDGIDSQIMEDLCNKYGETVNLGVRVDDRVIIVGKVDPETTLKASLQIGQHEPLHATSLGKVLCSELSKDELTRILGDTEFKEYTNNTITSLEQLIQELDKVREVGYAIDDEEFCAGLSCIAMPIRDYRQKIVAAISISGPSFRLNFSKIMSIKDGLEEACRKASSFLGAEIGDVLHP